MQHAGETDTDSEWDDLETIQDFELGECQSDWPELAPKGIMYSVPLLPDSGSPGGGNRNNASAPISLLVESLVQHLCAVLEREPERSKNLYKNICERLEQMKLIDTTWSMPEFDVMRTQYQNALVQLVEVAKGPEMLMPNSTSAGELIRALEKPVVDKDWSRYQCDFEELSYIAGGGFGQVYRARNKLDGIVYAVKKVIIRAESIDKVRPHLDEVKTLASLHHMNIVPYKTAWLEPLPANSEAVVDLTEDTVDDDEEEEEEDDGGDVESLESNHRLERNVKTTRRVVEEENELSDSVVVFQNSVGSGGVKELWSQSLSTHVTYETTTTTECSRCEEVSKAICPYESRKGKALQKRLAVDSQPQLNWAVLYIQMTECHLTLRTWLDERNNSPNFSTFYRSFIASGVERSKSTSSVPSSPDQVKPDPTHLEVVGEVFSQLIKGLSYMHGREIIHHDIKPRNIFISVENVPWPNMVVQLGDFGLACQLQQQHENKIIGTPQYAAPEQRKGKCDKKSDIYSLGLILLELLCKFVTDTERNLTVLGCTEKDKFPECVPHTYRPLLRRMLSRDVEDRPTAFELAESFRRIWRSTDPIVEDLQKKLSTQDEKIAELSALVATNIGDRNLSMEMRSKDDEIAHLKQKLAELQVQGEKSQRHIRAKHGETKRLKRRLSKQQGKGASSDDTM